MNNIFGQPYDYDRYQENSNVRPIQRNDRHNDCDDNDCHKHHECHEHHECHPDPRPCREECRQVAGTVFRINIPAGAEINILNLVELASPSGICLILRLPFLAGECKEC
jgi:hypothetical protein